MGVVLLVGIVFTLVGIMLIVVAISKGQKCTEITTGIVVDISRDENVHNSSHDQPRDSININGFSINSGRNISLYPIFEYEVNGNKYVKKGSSSSNNLHVGQELEIHYNPAKPDQYYIKSNLSQIILGAIFAIVGIVLVVVYFK